jgi:hypothetical protein
MVVAHGDGGENERERAFELVRSAELVVKPSVSMESSE